LFEAISELPFVAIAKLGFNRQKVEDSYIGRIVKGALYLVTVAAAFLTVLERLDFIDPVKNFVHEFVESKK
jgi:hypothetical protein